MAERAVSKPPKNNYLHVNHGVFVLQQLHVSWWIVIGQRLAGQQTIVAIDLNIRRMEESPSLYFILVLGLLS